MLGGGWAGGVLRFTVVASQCLNEGVCALSALFTADDTMWGSYKECQKECTWLVSELVTVHIRFHVPVAHMESGYMVYGIGRLDIFKSIGKPSCNMRVCTCMNHQLH